jgi:hypothetical protein
VATYLLIPEDFSVITKANCCSSPKLRIIEAIPNESEAKVSVQKCDTCQTFWQVIADQVIAANGDTLFWDWFQALNDEEALGILDSMAFR